MQRGGTDGEWTDAQVSSSDRAVARAAAVAAAAAAPRPSMAQGGRGRAAAGRRGVQACAAASQLPALTLGCVVCVCVCVVCVVNRAQSCATQAGGEAVLRQGGGVRRPQAAAPQCAGPPARERRAVTSRSSWRSSLSSEC